MEEGVKAKPKTKAPNATHLVNLSAALVAIVECIFMSRSILTINV